MIDKGAHEKPGLRSGHAPIQWNDDELLLACPGVAYPSREQPAHTPVHGSPESPIECGTSIGLATGFRDEPRWLVKLDVIPYSTPVGDRLVMHGINFVATFEAELRALQRRVVKPEAWDDLETCKRVAMDRLRDWVNVQHHHPDTAAFSPQAVWHEMGFHKKHGNFGVFRSVEVLGEYARPTAEQLAEFQRSERVRSEEKQSTNELLAELVKALTATMAEKGGRK